MCAAAMTLAACGSSSKKSDNGSSSSTTTAAVAQTRPQISVDASEYAFVVPASIPSGWVDFTLHNKGTQPHQMFIVNLGSMTFEQFKTRSATTDLTNLPADTTFVGGPNNVDPGQSVTATVHLDPGNYAVGCALPDTKDGKPHAAHGMIAQFTAAPTAQTVDTAPVADGGTITTSEFTFSTDSAFKGQGTVAMTNVGTQIHEVVIWKIADGKTVDDVKKFVLAPPGTAPPAGPPPFTSAGGVVGIGPHQTNYQKLALTPGNYVFFCFFPDVTNPQQLPHALKGMIKEFTIS
jgi:hypothetical protein